MYDSVKTELETMARMMTIGAAVLGLVVPLLARQPTVLASPSWLWRGALWLIGNLVAGVILHAVYRYGLVVLAFEIRDRYRALINFVAANGTEPDMRERAGAVVHAMEQSISKRRRVNRFTLVAVFDLVFYGTLITGLGCIARSVFP